MKGGRGGGPPNKMPKSKPPNTAYVPELQISEFQIDFANIPIKFDLNQVKSFQHHLKVTSKDVLEEIEAMKKLILQARKFAPPDDKILFAINQILNKITTKSDKIVKSSMDLINEDYFGSESFIETFSSKLLATSTEQNALSRVYARFLHIIIDNLPTIKQREDLYELINQGLLENTELTNGSFQFIGCLLTEGLIQISQILKIFNRLKNDLTERNVEGIYYLFRCCFHYMNENYSDFKKDLTKIINLVKQLTNVRSQVKFLMYDFQDEFSANKITGYLDRNVNSIEETILTDIPPETKSSLILSKFINTNEIPTRWNTQMTFDYFASLLMSPNKDFTKGLGLIPILIQSDNLIFKESSLKEIKKLEKISRKFESGLNKIGAIYANLYVLGCIDDLNKNIFDNYIFVGFIGELRRINKTQMIQNTDFFLEYAFLPKLRSHSQIVSDLEEFGIIDMFPLYADMKLIFDIIRKGEDEKLIINILKKEHSEQEKVLLVEYLTEIIVIQRPAEYNVLLQYIYRRPIHSLKHIEVIGELFEWKPEQTATSIYKLAALILYDIEEFKNTSGNEYHNDVSKFL
ncbi:hypothetical protein TVAG_099470 [Trichomonas vaginalis G3]|uniref:Uncharacterized protein n=1 Tax=Trichomonas vaginalis (strain ATCC PRA-98 / G3) TaxID=412133 RepID=A2FXV7_TRIV3|nr:armadillo (ARM) repeat-containing protein family [Trichomonas vaginalis G3]EAX90261.1 hypothetical protein TVAG_099470 [Trichomonas vaginalis G3]KAI5499863.1 armadillo (ARM) repeat-containing protein family [Trichomonas vaginalis G3]|eukprot:XP_001303191.1 hypothetical protein [Trichomonas vaginalis G3]